MDVPSALKHQPLVMGGYGNESYLVRTCNLLELLLGLLFGDDLLVELVRMIHLTQVAVCLAYLDRRRVALHPARGCVRAFARSECGCVSASSPSLSAHHIGHGYPRAVRASCLPSSSPRRLADQCACALPYDIIAARGPAGLSPEVKTRVFVVELRLRAGEEEREDSDAQHTHRRGIRARARGHGFGSRRSSVPARP